jgi:hypothetical protein
MWTAKQRNAYMRNYVHTYPEFELRTKTRGAANRLRLKKEVLTRYGKRQKLQCCWRGCTIVDVDMLTLDHIADNGADHRSEITKGKYRGGGGINFYGWVKRHGFPVGFQTLCHNHQWKKEILRRRAAVGKMDV